MAFIYPGSDLDDRQTLLDQMGSYWSEDFAGKGLVGDIVFARAQTDLQTFDNLLELAAAVSRFTVPVFHQERWQLLKLFQSQAVVSDLSMPKFGDPYFFDAYPEIFYGVPVGRILYAWPLPTDLADVSIITNRVTDASAMLVKGTDFIIDDGMVTFFNNPFNDPLFPQAPIVNNGVPDQTLSVWLYNGQHDRSIVYRQFGYAVGLNLPSTPQYRDLVNTIYDGLLESGAALAAIRALALACDVPCVKNNGETVQAVFNDGRFLWVVTDQNAYPFNTASNAIVAAGQAVNAGDQLVDTIRYFDLRSGVVPNPLLLPSITVGPGLLAPGYSGPLTFKNSLVPLQVNEADPSGYTRVSFEVDGAAADTVKFWNDVHTAGVARGQTLAMLLDQRAVPFGQPTLGSLPEAINPLGFMTQEVWRDNAAIVTVKTALFGTRALGLDLNALLRKIVPPQTFFFIVSQ
jgi:hypothetical protein